MIRFNTFFISYFFIALNINAQVAHTLNNREKQSENTSAYTDELKEKYYQISNDLNLLNRGKPTIYKEHKLGAIQFPVGGIGTGCIQFNGEAVPRYWQIFNNMSHEFVPNSFFVIRVKNKNGIQIRALQTKSIKGIQPMKALQVKASFPFLEYNFLDNLPINVTMKVGNPFVPTNLKYSSIPCAFYKFTIKNTSDKPVEISLLASQQNAVGLSKMPPVYKVDKEKSFAAKFQKNINRTLVKENTSTLYGNNQNKIIKENLGQTLYMKGDSNINDEHFGQMALLLLPENTKKTNFSGTAQWQDRKLLIKNFKNTGAIKGKNTSLKSKKENTYNGALSIKTKLKPREEITWVMALAWYFPNGKNGGHLNSKWDPWGKGEWEGKGNYYANYWSDIHDLTNFIYKNYKNILAQSNTFTQTFYKTNLPYWLTERIANQLSILKSKTIFHDKRNYVGLWEGSGAVDGSCSGNCSHVWHYAQAHARLFPSLGRKIRTQSFNLIKEDGQLPYRQPAGGFAFDGQCGEIIAAYREALLSNNDRWLKNLYPNIKKALNYLIKKFDADKDGWLSDIPKHTTYDAPMSGNPSFLTSLYVCALRSGEKMAKITQDNSQAKEWRLIADKSIKFQNNKLWNGEYFVQIPGEKHGTDYNNGCQSDQLLGQWWADQLGLGNLYPSSKIKSSTQAILKYNFKADLKKHNQGGRKFALPSEAGIIGTTWPKKDRPPYASGYSDEIWSTYEYTIGSSLLKYGLIRDAMTLLKSGYHRYDGELKTDYPSTNGWGNFGFSGNPFGDEECGQFYARALSIWSVLLAAQGFHYNGMNKYISFNPKWQPQNHLSFFSTASAWGLFGQKIEENNQQNSLQIKYGKLFLNHLKLIKNGLTSKNITVYLNNKKIKVKIHREKNQYLFSFFDTLILKQGDSLLINL